MSERVGLGRLLESRRGNAALSWALVALVTAVAAESVLTGDFLWVGFILVVLALALVPPLTYRTPSTMLPWEVLALCSLPVLGRALATDVLLSDLSTYVAVAALALVVAVELDVFTPVRMPPWFAVVFVAIATLATAGVLAVAQWAADVTLGTTFIYPVPVGRPESVVDGGLLDALSWLGEVFVRGGDGLVSAEAEHVAHDTLMWDFVAAAVAGIAAGGVFESYFRRRARAEERLPEGVREVVEESPGVEEQ